MQTHLWRINLTVHQLHTCCRQGHPQEVLLQRRVTGMSTWLLTLQLSVCVSATVELSDIRDQSLDVSGHNQTGRFSDFRFFRVKEVSKCGHMMLRKKTTTKKRSSCQKYLPVISHLMMMDRHLPLHTQLNLSRGLGVNLSPNMLRHGYMWRSDMKPRQI